MTLQIWIKSFLFLSLMKALLMIQKWQGWHPECVLLSYRQSPHKHGCRCWGSPQLLKQRQHNHCWNPACVGPIDHCEGPCEQLRQGQCSYSAWVAAKIILHRLWGGRHQGSRKERQGWIGFGSQAMSEKSVRVTMAGSIKLGKRGLV